MARLARPKKETGNSRYKLQADARRQRPTDRGRINGLRPVLQLLPALISCLQRPFKTTIDGLSERQYSVVSQRISVALIESNVQGAFDLMLHLKFNGWTLPRIDVSISSGTRVAA